MLRGRCSCAISGRPGTSSAPRIQLTPLFPLHPGKSPVSALFPLLTQKQGGGDTSNQMIFANAPLRLSNPGGYNRLENFALNFVPSTVNCKPAFLTPAFTTTSIDIVGAPTFLTLHASRRSQERPASEGGPYTNFELLFSANFNYSRTYAREPRKSNHSRTYAKTGGRGPQTKWARR